MVRRSLRILLLACFFSAHFGCGYTQKSLLPESIKAITVIPVKNAIDLSGEISDKNRLRVTRPGIEVDLTNAIINRFIFDGNLKVVLPEKANAAVEAKIIEYRRDAVRYTNADEVQEYRVSLVIDVAVYETKDHKILWQDPHLIGDTSFFLTGSRAVSEDQAAAKAVEDVARRVVERTIEIW